MPLTSAQDVAVLAKAYQALLEAAEAATRAMEAFWEAYRDGSGNSG